MPLVMWAGQSALRVQIDAQHPEFDPAEVVRSADIALTSAAVFHGVLLVLIRTLATARPWTRRLTTVSQLRSVVFSVSSWSSSPMFHAVIPIVGVVHIIVVVLLWASRSAREFLG